MALVTQDRAKALNTNRDIRCFFDFFDACCARISTENEMGFHVNHGRVAP